MAEATPPAGPTNSLHPSRKLVLTPRPEEQTGCEPDPLPTSSFTSTLG